MAKKQKKPVVSIVQIELRKSILDLPEEFDTDKARFEYSVNIDTFLDEEDRFIYTITDIAINLFPDGPQLALVSVECYFEIVGFDRVVKITTDDFEIESEFADLIDDVSLSTTRGVMFCQLRGTALQLAIPPMMDMRDR